MRLIGLVIFASFMCWTNASAQRTRTHEPMQPLTYRTTGALIEVGDSVMISRDTTHYQTKEHIIRWAFNKVHIVRQVNSKYHPNSILLRGIYSWISADAAVPLNKNKQYPYDPNQVQVNEDNTTLATDTTSTTADAVNLVPAVIVQSDADDQEEEGKAKKVRSKKARAKEKASKRETKQRKRKSKQTEETSLLSDSVAVADTATIAATALDSNATAKSVDVANSDSNAISRADRDSLAMILFDKVMDALLQQQSESAYKEIDRFSIALRAGFASTMAKPTPAIPMGFDARFDLQYAHYWKTQNQKSLVGLLIGASIGYMQTNRDIVWDETWTANTSDGDVLYHVTADNIRETNQQLQVEVPVMLALMTEGGFYFNVGPRVMLPIRTPFKQVINNGHISATDLETTDVMLDNVIYGKLTEDQTNITGMTKQQFDITLMVGLELGHEFRFASGNSFGFGLYANYGVYSTYSNRPLGTIIDVTAPNYDKIATVDVYSMTDAYTTKMGHLDVGVKLSFNFDTRK